MNKYEITWKDGTTEIVECDMMNQQNTTVLFLDVGAVQNNQGQVQGEIIMAANFLEMKCFKKVPKLEAPRLVN